MKRLEGPSCRLLTLTGPGGIGKTRLALEAAHQLAGTWRDGVRFVPLAAMDEPKRLALTPLEALQLSPSQVPPEVQLREHLRSRRMLLLLDSMEHLLEATPLLAELLAHAPGLELLVTSRERLNLRGEWLLPLNGLPSPPSLELFALLAGRVSASFQLGPDNEAALARICQLVEGSPLAPAAHPRGADGPVRVQGWQDLPGWPLDGRGGARALNTPKTRGVIFERYKSSNINDLFIGDSNPPLTAMISQNMFWRQAR